MGVLNIRLAEREGARLVIGLAGISGSGKTYTALQLAFGLANFDSKKIGFLDTENRRGSLYADSLKNDKGQVQQFYIGDLDAPFSPQRYIDAILEFQALGVEVLVIDSTTHEWEGSGGCEEIASSSNPKFPDWKKAKAEHKRFMNALLQSNMHVICCIRAREKVEITKVDGKTTVTPLGIMPITEKNFMFEMTASLMMWNEGSQQQVMKCPADLQAMLGRTNNYITAEDGQAIRKWVDGSKLLDPKVEQARNTLRTTTEQGMEALVAAWTELPVKIRKAINPTGCPDEYKSAAAAFDAQRVAEQPGGTSLAELNNQILGDGAQDAA